MPEATEQFDKYTLKKISHLGVQYDYASIMHYGPYAFSQNGRRTITPLKTLSYDVELGQRRGFSEIDLQKINKLYSCETSTGGEGDEDGSGVQTTTQSPTPEVCEDKDWRCSFYKLRIFGYCGDGPRQDAEIKYRLCPRSCGVCDEQVPASSTTTTTPPSPVPPAIVPATVTRSCVNVNKMCPRWARRGNCRRAGYVDFMAENCPASCGVCDEEAEGNGEENEVGEEDCQDDPARRTTCTVSKVLRQCNTSGARKYCRKTCNHC